MEEKLRLVYRADFKRRGMICHEFDIFVGETRVGECFLREGDSTRIMTLGNVGYRIDEEHRGHSYAALSLKALARVAKLYGIGRLVICCLPTNAASCRSCEKAGAVLDTTLELCENDDSYAYGTRFVRRYFMECEKQPEL